MRKVKISELKETIGVSNLEILTNSILKSEEDELDLSHFVKCIPVVMSLTSVKKIVDGISLFFNDDEDYKLKIDQIRKIINGAPEPTEEKAPKRRYSPQTTVDLPSLTNEEKEWYNDVIEKVKIIGKTKGNTFSGTLRKIYKYMNVNYGVVWTQCMKEVREKYDTEPEAKISKMRCIIEDETLRSIFSCLVDDFLEDPTKF